MKPNSLTEELVNDMEISRTIETLRIHRLKLREICEVLQHTHERLKERKLVSLMSAVSRAVYRLCGNEMAAQISDELHVVPKIPYVQRAMSDEDRKRVSIEGVKAQGKHVWGEAEEKLLMSCIESVEAQNGERQGAFWEAVSKLMKERHSMDVSASSCRNKRDKIRRRQQAA